MAKLTLLDLAKRTKNDATVGIVDATTQNNALLSLLPFRGIKGPSFKYARRSSLPTVSFKGINQGIANSKSIIDQILVEAKNVGGRSEVDKLLAESDPRGINALRAEEDAGFGAAMGNIFNSKAFYGNSVGTTGLEFDGIATLMNALSKDTVVAAGGDSANVATSVYILAFKDANSQIGRLRGVEGILGNNKNMTAIDMGLQYATDADSKKFLAYTTEFEFSPGLAVYDDRSVGRLCNVDSGSLPTITLLNTVIANMRPYIPSAIFVNKLSWLALQAVKATTMQSTNDDRDLFRSVLMFNGIPIFIDDNITQTEAVVA